MTAYKNNLGRVLNRFSKDLGLIDDLMPSTLMDFTYVSCVLINRLSLFVVIQFFKLK